MVKTFIRVRKTVRAKLLLVGDGPEHLRVERMVKKLEISDCVFFLGNQEYVEDILPLADVFLLPSLHESFGLSLLEAMAVGVPVVATNVGGPKEVVVEGESGFLRDPEDVESMSEAATRILSDPDLARSMGEAGIRRAREEFHVDRIIPRYLKAYESCE